jgi:hypothetical protein
MNCCNRSQRHHDPCPHQPSRSPATRVRARGGFLLFLLHLATLAGCVQTTADLSEVPPESIADGQRATMANHGPDTPTSEPVRDDPADQQESVDHWAACFVQGNQVGFTHLVTERVWTDGQWCQRYRYQDELKMRRFEDTTVVRSKLECLEDATGNLLRFRSEVETGPSAMITEGYYDQGQLRMELQTAGRTEDRVIAWQAGWGGFFADHRSLRDKPMKPRESRRLSVLLPILHQVGEIHLQAVGYESVPLLETTRQLLRIDMTTLAGGTSLRSIIWCDERGTVWKTRDLQLDLEAFRCDRETALRPTSGEGFDLGASTVVRVTKPLLEAHKTTRAVYHARLPQGEIEQVFVQDGSQSIRTVAQDAVELTVVSVRPDRPARFPDSAWTGPTEADREPTAWIQSDDARIIDMASQIAPEETHPWRLACELERFVKRTVHMKNYSTAMATAAEVAKSLEGDCTEHAMLLAALCRARQIPARVAIGLVYYPPAQGFAYHMWTEVWIADRWIGMDATLGQGGTSAAHVKLAVSSMDGSSAFADMLPIIQVIRRLELQVLSVEGP